MAPKLFSVHHSKHMTTGIVANATLVLICAIALLMCASHSKKWLRRGRWLCMSCCTSADVADDHDMVIQVLDTHATILTTKSRAYVEIEEGEVESSGPISGVWRKGILMGKKCQLPDHSGAIIYDSDGRLVVPSKLPKPHTPLS